MHDQPKFRGKSCLSYVYVTCVCITNQTFEKNEAIEYFCVSITTFWYSHLTMVSFVSNPQFIPLRHVKTFVWKVKLSGISIGVWIQNCNVKRKKIVSLHSCISMQFNYFFPLIVYISFLTYFIFFFIIQFFLHHPKLRIFS